MEQIAKIGNYITIPDCTTTGTVKNIKEGVGTRSDRDPMSVYRIETDQGMIRASDPTGELGKTAQAPFQDSSLRTATFGTPMNGNAFVDRNNCR
jgi:hypothetical protein